MITKHYVRRLHRKAGGNTILQSAGRSVHGVHATGGSASHFNFMAKHKAKIVFSCPHNPQASIELEYSSILGLLHEGLQGLQQGFKPAARMTALNGGIVSCPHGCTVPTQDMSDVHIILHGHRLCSMVLYAPELPDKVLHMQCVTSFDITGLLDE